MEPEDDSESEIFDIFKNLPSRLIPVEYSKQDQNTSMQRVFYT